MELIDAALSIGLRIAAEARWKGPQCDWQVWVPARLPGTHTGKTEDAPCTLYQGTAGIALFLIELFRLTADAMVRRTAQGALEHAVDLGKRLPGTNCGFHSGRVGIAYAAYRFGLTTGDDEYIQKAADVLTPLKGSARTATSFDVIGGAAGAIPILLRMADTLPSDATSEFAVQVGHHILARARREHIGFSWHGSIAAVRELTGYAHGASGFAHALVELYAATGHGGFRYGALQAIEYERQFFDAERNNWPDFRHVELSEYTATGRLGVLKERVRSGDALPPYRKSFMSAWCHGAPGIGLARLRAFDVLRRPELAAEAEIAANTTLESLQNTPIGYSLCHGIFGNCETLVEASRVLGRPELLAAAEQRVSDGILRFEAARRRWPCGTVGGVPDPSLMVGEAGIGYFLLRLHDAGVPSILCPIRGKSLHAADADAVSETRLCRDHIAAHLSQSLRAVALLSPHVDPWREVMPPDHIAPVVHARRVIKRHVDEESASDRRALLLDAAAVDEARFALNDSIDDLTEDLFVDLTRPSEREVPWRSAQLQLATAVTLVKTTRDWSVAAAGVPPASPTVTAVYRHEGIARAQVLSEFAALVLEAARAPGTLSTIVGRVANASSGVSQSELASPVEGQLRYAYQAGLVDWADLAPANSSPPAPGDHQIPVAG